MCKMTSALNVWIIIGSMWLTGKTASGLEVTLYKHTNFQGHIETHMLQGKECISLGETGGKASSVKLDSSDACVKVCTETCDFGRGRDDICRPVFGKEKDLGVFSDRLRSLERCTEKDLRVRSTVTYEVDLPAMELDSNEMRKERTWRSFDGNSKKLEKRHQHHHHHHHKTHNNKHIAARPNQVQKQAQFLFTQR